MSPTSTEGLEVKETSCCSGRNETSSKVEQSSSNIKTSAIGEKIEYRVHGMDCPSCALTIEKGLSRLKDIQEAKINYNTAKLQVVSKDSSSFEQVENEIQKLGFKAEPIKQNKSVRTYYVEGMDCGSCATSIENHLNTIPTVNNVRVNFSTGKMKVEHENSVDEIVSEVSKIGYKASLRTSNTKSAETRKNKEGYGLITFSGILIALGFIGSYNGTSPFMTTTLYVVAIVISGYKPIKSAYYAIKSRSLDMNVLMSAAAIGAAIMENGLKVRQ